MSDTPAWWSQPRRIAVVVDNPSWIVPFAHDLVDRINAGGDEARFCATHDEIGEVAVAFYLGCIRLSPPEVLARAHRNLVVHESDLPRGRGMSPLTWQIIEGRSQIPVCLLYAADEVDAGPVVYRDTLTFEGHELVDELRDGQGRVTVELCLRFLSEDAPKAGTEQEGEASVYPRRTPKDNALDPEKTIAEQFDLLRTFDNARYPAYFDYRGHRYRLAITKAPPGEQP